jgi:hypothetical protein
MLSTGQAQGQWVGRPLAASLGQGGDPVVIQWSSSGMQAAELPLPLWTHSSGWPISVSSDRHTAGILRAASREVLGELGCPSLVSLQCDRWAS